MSETKVLLKQFQGVCFEMYLKEFITEKEFKILENITNQLEKNNDALELAVSLMPKDLEDKDLVDCILAEEFKTARIIKGNYIEPLVEVDNAKPPWD